MPGGIGQIDADTALACRAGGAGWVLPTDMTESEVFYRLGIGRAFYSAVRQRLYFADSPHAPVADIVSAVLQGLGRPPVFEQLHLDPHHVFPAARRVAIHPGEAIAVLVALRLHGIRVAEIR